MTLGATIIGSTQMTEELKPCPCGRDSSDDNAVQEAAVNLVSVKAATGGRAYRVECTCGWAGPVERFAEEAITAWNTRLSHSAEKEALIEALGREAQSVWRCAIGDAVGALDVLLNDWKGSKRKAEREAGEVLSRFLEILWAARDPAPTNYRDAAQSGKALLERARSTLLSMRNNGNG